MHPVTLPHSLVIAKNTKWTFFDNDKVKTQPFQDLSMRTRTTFNYKVFLDSDFEKSRFIFQSLGAFFSPKMLNIRYGCRVRLRNCFDFTLYRLTKLPLTILANYEREEGGGPTAGEIRTRTNLVQLS